MNKQLLCTLKLILPAANATPNSILGSALGPFGVNILAFCKEFNNLTLSYKGFSLSVKLLIYSDKKYKLILKTPTTTNLLYEFCKDKKGSFYLTNRLTEDQYDTIQIFSILTHANKLAHEFSSYYIEPIHIFASIYLKSNIFSFFFTKNKETITKILTSLLMNYSQSPSEKTSTVKLFSIKSLSLLNKALSKKLTLNSIDLMSLLIVEEDIIINKFLELLNLNKQIITDILKNFTNPKISIQSEFLNKYTKKIEIHDVNQSIIERPKELNTIIQILTKKIKCNPVLVGEIGVGKSSLVKSLIKKFKQNDICPKLQNKDIRFLNLPLLLKNSQYKGEFEEQFESLIQASKFHGNLILICFDIHSLFNLFNNQGSEQESISSLTLFKTAFYSKDIQFIGITTPKEYLKQSKINPHLNDFFDKVIINEPTDFETFQILTKESKLLEKFHNLIFAPLILKETIELSKKYLKNKFFPVKALELLDLACVSHNVNTKYLEVTDLYKATALL
ncbi:hypothetical protein IE077_001060 [Cardiosporidium cionae]|uniref:50S ribosomal protein L11 n=1 Tax=Cardiosporidium cionae TaxID=476202 RepID=A0ABQ7J5Y3_9APIC|nr:hypothetical protein IE077_001060 [Cardiosporidium cionae]|eukprot:KAF8819409.1 hypothetical protein IE077_001060 [Cardiosporidium cionae]